jgi:hypothetical protein
MLTGFRAFLNGCDDAAEFFGIGVDAVKFGYGQIIRIPQKA